VVKLVNLDTFAAVMRAGTRARVYGRKAGNFTNFTTRPEAAVAKVLRLLVSSANVVSDERNRGIEQ